MGFRVTIVERPTPPSRPATRAEIAEEAAVVDRYLRALQAAHPASPASAEFGHLEREFVRVASSFSTRLGISYAAWRDVDVAAADARRGGHPRCRAESGQPRVRATPARRSTCADTPASRHAA